MDVIKDVPIPIWITIFGGISLALAHVFFEKFIIPHAVPVGLIAAGLGVLFAIVDACILGT